MHRGQSSLGFALGTLFLLLLGLFLFVAIQGPRAQLREMKQDTARLEMAGLQHALRRYHARTGVYPHPATGLHVLVETKLLEQIPRDPWDREFVYRLEAGKPVLLSYGANGRPGGQSEDEDLVSRGR